jgi:protease-4
MPFGELEDALAYAARRRSWTSWHADSRRQSRRLAGLLQAMAGTDSSSESRAATDVTGLVALRQQALACACSPISSA